MRWHGDDQPRLVDMYAITETADEVSYRRVLARVLDLLAQVSAAPPTMEAFTVQMAADLKEQADAIFHHRGAG